MLEFLVKDFFAKKFLVKTLFINKGNRIEGLFIDEILSEVIPSKEYLCKIIRSKGFFNNNFLSKNLNS